MNKTSQQITVVISRRVKTGFEQEFQSSLEELHSALKNHSGFVELKQLATTENAGQQKVISLVTFASLNDFLAWEASSARKQLLAKLQLLVDGEIHKEMLGDINLLATSKPAQQKWKTVIALIGWIIILGFLINPLLQLILPITTPELLTKLIATSITVLLISYGLLPLTMKLIAKLSSKESAI